MLLNHKFHMIHQSLEIKNLIPSFCPLFTEHSLLINTLWKLKQEQILYLFSFDIVYWLYHQYGQGI